MKLEESIKQNTNETSLDQTQEAVAVPQSQEELLETKIENIEKIADQVDDFSPAELAEIKNLGGDENELAEELAPVDEEIKRTRSGFIDRAKNYVVSLATMVASVGNMSGANTDQKVKDKAETNVVYVDDENDARFKAYQDSLRQYNIGEKDYIREIDLQKKAIMRQKNNSSVLPERKIFVKKEKFNEEKEKSRKDNWQYKTFVKGVSNKPIETIEIKNRAVNSVLKSFENLTGLSLNKNYNTGNESSLDNVLYKWQKPKVEVKLKQTSESKPVIKKANTVEKKPNKSESKIIYVEDKNDPRLKVYQDSINTYVNYNKYIDEIKEVAKRYKISNDKKNPSYVSAIEADKINSELQKIDSKYKTYGKKLFKENLLKYDINSPTLLAFGPGPSMSYAYDSYDAAKPLVEVKYKPKPKLTETKLNPKDVLHIPLEETEVNLLANLKQKEIIKASEKTGYTVRVGEKLFYLSKEDVNKLEADKTTFYNSSEQGNGAEQHLVWRGNEQGQTLQQVAERLGIKLPIAFDTQEQKFENQ